MTPDDFAKKLDRAIKNLETVNTPFKKAVQDIHALRMGRIFDRGETSAGGKIGQYSTKPIYINPKKVGFSFTPKGKGKSKTTKVFDIATRKAKRVAIKSDFTERKTRYFAEGYKGFRKMLPRPTSYVDLGLKYDMRFDLSNSTSLKKPGMPVKISTNEYHERFKRPYNAEKFAGNEKRFKVEIGNFSQFERKEFIRVINFHLAKLLA